MPWGPFARSWIRRPPARNERRYLAVMTVENGKPGLPVQLQQSTFAR
jgi:hypothetical protein